MTGDEIRAVFAAELERIAPGVEVAAADPDADLRETFEMDSMDFLNLVAALHARLGVEIPETDYPRLASVNDAVAYLAERTDAPA